MTSAHVCTSLRRMEHNHTIAAPNLLEKHAVLMRRATYASIGVATVLLIAKIIAWWSTESLAMLSSLTDSLFDLVASIINMFAVRYALKPADDDHAFGHTSIEDLAGLAQFVFISASMAIIILQSVERLFNPHPLANEALGIGVSIFAIVMTSGLVLFQTYVAKTTGSLIIATDRMHYLGDVFFNLGVLAAIVLSAGFGITMADPLIAILIACLVLWSTVPLGQRAYNNLMDREMPDAEKEKIKAAIANIPEIYGYHNLKTRYSGMKAFIQLHIDIDASLNFKDAHAITERLEDALLVAFPGAEVIIHPDPVERSSSGDSNSSVT
jgi:ferrous-iron efflux pump FieF